MFVLCDWLVGAKLAVTTLSPLHLGHPKPTWPKETTILPAIIGNKKCRFFLA